MPPMPFVHRNIHTLRLMLPHTSPIQQNRNTLLRSPPYHNRTHTVLLSRGQSSHSTIPQHTNIMEIRSDSFLQSRHRARTFQTKRHLAKYNSKVHRTCSGQECARSHRPAKIRSTCHPPPDDFLEKYNNYIKPIAKYTIQGKINATPQLLPELKKYSLTNYTKLFEPDYVKPPRHNPDPTTFIPGHAKVSPRRQQI